MSNFLDRVKDCLRNPRKMVDSRDSVIVPSRDLRELVLHFERLDSDARLRHNSSIAPVEQHLHEAISALYHERNRDAELVLLIIMDTLRPLIEEKRREERRYTRG